MKAKPYYIIIILTVLTGISANGQDMFILDRVDKPRFILTDKVWPQEIGEAAVCLWNDDKLSAFTITIDDNYEDDIPFWERMHEKYGFHFTWFVITQAAKDLNVKNWESFRRLAQKGHAIQGHDDRNWFEDEAQGIGYPSVWRYNKRLGNTKRTIEKKIKGQKCETYAYPWGEGNTEEVANHFIASRGVFGLLNSADLIDFKQVRSISNPHIYLNDSTRNRYVLPLLDTLSQLEGKNYYRGWGSVHFHAVSAPEKQKTTDEFLSYLKHKEEHLWVATFPEVAKYAQEYATHSLKVESISDSLISMNLTDGMINETFDFPLSIKVRIPNHWNSILATQNGKPIDSKMISRNNDHYVLFKAIPDRGRIILQKGPVKTSGSSGKFPTLELGTLQDGYYIPKIISKEAGEILNKRRRSGRFTATLPRPDGPLAEWIDYQEKLEKRILSALGPIKEFYKPNIDTVELGAIRALEIKPYGYKKNDKVIVYFHGGGYVSLSADATLASMLPLGHKSGLKIIAIDYTLAPQGNYESIMCEVIQFYRALLETYDPENIAFYGDSAGGGLAAGSILKLRDLNMPLPASLVLWSPWLDLSNVGDTRYTLADNDPSLIYPGFLENAALAYAPRSEFKNPFVSPVYGDYSLKFPPTLIQVGSKEIFLSDAIRLYRAMDEQGKEARLDVYEGMWHVWHGYYSMPESQIAVKNTMKFIMEHFKS